MQDNNQQSPFILVILDGWGIYKDYNGNAITQAKTPVFDNLAQTWPVTTLQASGEAVGLPAGQDGNSEAGHLNLGAGRIVEQDTLIISKAIKSGTFFKNSAFKATVDHLKKTKGNLHLFGLLTGWQSAHADPNHLLALLKFYREKGITNIYLHLFTDGRDSYKYGALKFLKKLRENMLENEKIATVIGRYYAMDRKKKWDRTEKAYNAITQGKADYFAATAEEAIQQAYNRGETDEFICPTIIVEKAKHNKQGLCVSGQPIVKVKNGDDIIFFNLRSDRTRQLTKAFVQKNFNKMNPSSFTRKKILKDLTFVAMTDFGPDLDNILSAFPSQDVKVTLPMVLKDLRQLYIAETEKFAHVTFFFNGGYADPVGGEERRMIPSPDVPKYDFKPEMSATKVTEEVIKSLSQNKHNFIVVNFANPDMVGHTGNLAAGIKACQVVDFCLGKIYTAIKKRKGVMIVTADHGNIEEMINEKTGEVDTQHSNFPVPLVLIDWRPEVREKPFKLSQDYKLRKDGVLGSVAPTILDLMKREKPKEMTEKSLIIH